MKAPTVLSKGLDTDITVKVESVLSWYAKRWPEECQALIEHAKRRRSGNPTGMSDGKMFMSKGAFPSKVMTMLPAAFVASFGTKERGLAFWHDNKERIIKKFWGVAAAFAANQKSQPKVRPHGRGL